MSVDLTTRYLGLDLSTPLVASAGPVTGDPGSWARLEASGAGAIVLPSLFEEAIEGEAWAVEELLDRGTDSTPEAMTYLPDLDGFETAADRFLTLVERAKEALTIPVIASLNGTTAGGWVRYARHLASAGADALELNMYDVVADPRVTAAEIEARNVELLEAVKAEVRVPVAVKLSPWYTALANVATRLAAAGADGLVLFNRFYQPDIDLRTLEVRPQVQISSPAALLVPLTWVGILHDQVPCSLAASGGVHEAQDVLKLLLAGADVVMTTSALLQRGPEHLHGLLAEVRAWMDERDYESVSQLRGSVSRGSVPDPHAYQRANYYQTIHSWPVRPG